MASVRQVIATLRTVESSDLGQATIHSHFLFSSQTRGELRPEWRGLDNLLIQLWKSHSIFPRAKYREKGDESKSICGVFPAKPTTIGVIHAIHAAASRGGKVSARVVLTYVLHQLDLWNWLTK